MKRPEHDKLLTFKNIYDISS